MAPPVKYAVAVMGLGLRADISTHLEGGDRLRLAQLGRRARKC